MGSSNSRVLTVDDVVSTIRPFRSQLSERDRRLFNYAKFEIMNEDMDETELYLDFEDYGDAMCVQPSGCSNPRNRLFVGYDGNDDLRKEWETLSLWRRAKAFIVKGLKEIARVLTPAPAIAGPVERKAIGQQTNNKTV